MARRTKISSATMVLARSKSALSMRPWSTSMSTPKPATLSLQDLMVSLSLMLCFVLLGGAGVEFASPQGCVGTHYGQSGLLNSDSSQRNRVLKSSKQSGQIQCRSSSVTTRPGLSRGCDSMRTFSSRIRNGHDPTLGWEASSGLLAKRCSASSVLARAATSHRFAP